MVKIKARTFFGRFGRSYDRRRWVRKHLHRQEMADVVVVSHTKSGRTWLRVMISRVYQQKYDLPSDLVLKFDSYHRIEPRVPRIYFNRDTRVPTFSDDQPFVPLGSDKKVVFLVRDPRDVAVSFFFHVRNRATVAELERKGIPEAARSLSLYEFATAPELGVIRVVRHFNRWLDEFSRFQQRLVIRYEDMRADAGPALHRVMDFVGENVTAAQIEEAVKFASFESLQRKEQEGFFRGDSLRARNVGDRDTFKVRRGKVGGFRDYFTDEQIESIDALIAELSPSFGYGREDRGHAAD